MIDTTKRVRKLTVGTVDMQLRGVDVSDTTTQPADVLAGKEFYGSDEQKKTGLIETYAGSSSVTPSNVAQTLATEGKYLSSDITINPMPALATLRATELPNVTFKLYYASQGTDTLVDTKSTGSQGGSVDFSVSETGTYKLYAYDSNDTLLWSDLSILVDQLGVVKVIYSGKSLDNYTRAEIHTASDGGYAHNMFKIGSKRKYVQSGSVFNNLYLFIENIVSEGGKDYIDWRTAGKLSATRPINPQFGYVTSSSATSWSKTYSSNGGQKYSQMQQAFMKQGDAVYSQAQGILPDDYTGSLTTGTKMSNLKYTDGTSAKLYDYDKASDSFAEATTPVYSNQSSAQSSCKFIKGYFKSVGQIDEATFNAGKYYTYDSSNYVYTLQSTWASGTTYYGLYEFMQEDGAVLAGLSDIRQYMVSRTRKASAGGTSNYLSTFSCLVNLPVIEEIFGVNKTTTLQSGTSAQNANAYNLSGEGSKLKVYDDWTYLCIGSEYWTASTISNTSYNFCIVYNTGGINGNVVSNSYGVRPGFRTC